MTQNLREWINENRSRYSTLLDGLDEPNAVEATVIRTVLEVNKTSHHYRQNQRLVRKLANDISVLLDHVLMYRREIDDFEAAQISFALDYELSRSLIEADAFLQGSDRREPGWTHRRDALEAASGKTSTSMSPLEGAFAVLWEGFSKGESANIAASAKWREAIEHKYSALRGHHALLGKRHSEYGGALNFRQRRARLLALLADDCALAWEKTVALGQGIANRYPWGTRLAPPNPDASPRFATWDGAGFLEEWVLWTRRVGAALDREDQWEDEVETCVTLGMHQTSSWSEVNSGIVSAQARTFTQLVPGLRASLENRGQVSFSFEAGAHGLPPRFAAPRLRGLAASISVDDPTRADAQHARWQVYVLPPGCTLGVTIPDVPVFPVRSAWVISSECWEASVNEPGWRLQLHPNMWRNGSADDPASTDPKSWRISDVKLHLKMVVRQTVTDR
jgi:hypothetical protein